MGIGAVIVAWVVWGAFARVTLWDVSADSRVESSAAAHVVGAPLAGRVLSVHVELGQPVAAGDVLLELESAEIRAAERESVATRDALAAQLAAIDEEIDAARGLVDAIGRGSRGAVAEADAERERADAEARWARVEQARIARLGSAGATSERDLARAVLEAEMHTSQALAAAHATQRIAADARTRAADAVVRLESLRRERVRLRGEHAAEEAQIQRLEVELARRRIVAPIAGTVGELSALRPGSVVTEGERLVALVPDGPLRVVGHFAASSALGRVSPGQRAQMRMDAFPWTRFGMIGLVVARVGNEPRDGLVRVELEVTHAPSSIPIAHGLEGSVEVAVERVSPIELVLRAVGQALDGDVETGRGGASR
ncbi:HlyD family secretion protein [Sandaracinus amylolyticus]|uniref:HlyD family secretion protein n=1 Tax=Sandaracinus amylolyticus TaxID=927083 RepID=UPI00069E4586|nr:HlyD family efflux transporter periplasmic adaptor subunit [Sandaracinus amylolyticus]